MTVTSQSPVSPIEMTPLRATRLGTTISVVTPNQTTNTTLGQHRSQASSQLSQPSDQPSNQPSNQPTNQAVNHSTIQTQNQATSSPAAPSKPIWLPFTFRWYFLLLPILTSLFFGIATLLLVWYSEKNQGLGGDDGSPSVLFGWRFTPTLLAVLYTQMTVILFEDAKRTEPFARLAKAPATGASAYGTVLQTPRAWWAIFKDVVFHRKKIGKTSWCLVCCALINIFALLVISPLSAALLTSEEVSVSMAIDFTRMMPKNDSQLPLDANRETYFRTVAALMKNISTSAWMTDTTVTLPFWPSTENAQLGQSIQSSFQSWTTETTTLQADHICQNMTLESAELTPKRYVGYDVLGHGPYKGNISMVSFKLSSKDGCRYELALHPAIDLAYNGGVRWSNASTYYLSGSVLLHMGKVPFAHNLSDTSPQRQFSASPECRDRELILMSTPWTKLFRMEDSTIDLKDNQTYERSADFRMKGLLCEARHTMIKRNITTTMGLDGVPKMETTSGNAISAETPLGNLVDMDAFNSITMQDNWQSFFYDTATDVDQAMGGFTKPGTDLRIRPQIPTFNGMAPLLGVVYSFNLTAVLDDPHLIKNILRTRGRFFAECLRGALVGSKGLSANTVMGHVTLDQERVIVLREIGIIIASLLLASTFLLLGVYFLSRLSFRPLGLHTDPGSTVGMSLLLQGQATRSSIFRSQHLVAKPDFYRSLRSETFYSMNGSLHTGSGKRWSSRVNPSPSQKQKRWQPLVIRLRMLVALCCLLTSVLIAVMVLNSFSARSRLSQLAFIYEADVSKFRLSFSTFAPFSIAPTVISIVIGLWWDHLDMTFRILQPYIAMAQRPTPVCSGAGLTYRSKTWAGAAIKAARNKHWLLFMIAIGSVWCQILTVSMSALFERKMTPVSRQVMLDNSLGIRQEPVITNIRSVTDRIQPERQQPYLQPFQVLSNLMGDARNNWITGAAVQLSLNGTTLPWSRDGWSFVPLNLAQVQNSSTTPRSGAQDAKSKQPTNATVQTSAIRARLECNRIPEIANASSWIRHAGRNATWLEYMHFTEPKLSDLYTLESTMFDGTPSNTTTYTNQDLIICCANGTQDNPQRAAIGFWSPTRQKEYPFVDNQWPIPFVVKWIVGKARAVDWPEFGPTFIKPLQRPVVFEEVPSIQAARCLPVIESADMKIIVDQDTGLVHSHQQQSPTVAVESAWSESFVRHQLTDSGKRFALNYSGPLNMTTSYGVLFMDTLFGSAAGSEDATTNAPGTWQRTSDNSFIMRDENNGLNMDLMSYTMFSLAKKDPQVLLNYTTLVAYADRTLQTFFQHFIRNRLSLTNGGLVYQSVHDRSFKDLGVSINYDGSARPQQTFPELKATRKVEATISSRIRVLHMNTVATYLTVSILIWLIGTTALITCLQRKYTGSLIRDVQLIADVLVLIAGSDNFLELVAERGLAVKRLNDPKMMLGWFKDRQGEVRWGVEVVGGRNAVEWVDAPKQGFHVHNKPAKNRWVFWRRV